MRPGRPSAIQAADLVPVDPLNEQIWEVSPRVQAELQPPRSGWAEGEVGAQQAMCGAPALPWVPDLVGAASHLPGGVVVFGMAYSGFIQRSAGARGQLPAERYRSFRTAAEFCGEFTRTVSPAFRYYNNLLAALPAGVGAERVIFTDLCRVALVRVGARGDSSSGIERADPGLFCRYAEHPTNQRWHRQRLEASGARLIVALGHVAEHGVLRLLRDQLGCTIEAVGDSGLRFDRRSKPASWCTAYAHDARQVGAWGTTLDWWRAGGPKGRWDVVTIPHTSEREVDSVHVDRVRRAWQNLGGFDGR